MFRTQRQQTIAAACALLALAFSQTARATILPFTITPDPSYILGGFEGIHGGYGDNVNSTSAPGASGTTYFYSAGNGFTPEIAITYSHVDNAPSGSLGNSYYSTAGSWSDPVNYLHYQDGDVFWMTFTPTASYGVQINSFIVDLYGGVAGALNWKLRTGSTGGPIIDSGTLVGLTTASDPTVTPTNNLFYGTVVLEIDFSGTANFGNIGIDDLNFDQLLPPVPEPSTGLLIGLGGIGLAIKARRRRTVRC